MRSIEIRILGQNYSIRTEEDETYVKSLAKFVDKRLQEIYSTAPNVNHVKAAIMAAFSIADELFKAKSEQENLDKMIDEKTKILSGYLD
jgi:cell division protein ZapA